MQAYELTEEDKEFLSPEARYSDPVIRAAVNANPATLKALLAEGDPKYGPSAYVAPNDGAIFHYESALLAAIKAGLKPNIQTLLEAGADPNGLPLHALSQWSARFLRGRPYLPTTDLRSREDVLKDLPTPQTAPPTEGEVYARSRTRARFWAEHGFPWVTRIEPAMTALEAAAAMGDVSTIDELLRLGADTAAWRQQRLPAPPAKLSASFLATSSSLHQAIANKHHDAMRRLLDAGFAADVFPHSTTTCALNPLMAALAAEPPDLEGYAMLAASQFSHLDARTPVFNVHLLHIATANLSLDILRHVSSAIALSTAGTTSLGHNLLHIACLPLEDRYINHFSPKVHASIHDLRLLGNSNKGFLQLWPFKPPGQMRDVSPPFPLPGPTEYFAAQREVVQFLFTHGVTDAGAQDVHGNTPLHYVVAHRAVNEELLSVLQRQGAGQSVWENTRNEWGFTPRDLYDDGKATLRDMHERGEREDEVRYMPHWKDPMGAWVMGRWKSAYPGDK